MGITISDIKFVRSLQQKKFRKKHGLFVVEGLKTVKELMNSEVEVTDIYSLEKLDFLAENFTTVSQKELTRMSGMRSPNYVLAIAKIPNGKTIDLTSSMVLLLDGINDPGNLGTIIRTARWFGVTEILCSPNCVDAYDRKVVQSSMGALFHVNLVYGNALEWMGKAKESGYTIFGTEMNGMSIYETDRTEKTLMVLGSESHGISSEVQGACDQLISIPRPEDDKSVESLNAGVAAAIALSEFARKAFN